MQIHNVISHTKRKRSIKIGRGGKRGKTSGRGTKGQRARSGHRMRPEIRDIIKRIPYLRGRGLHSLKPNQAPFAVVNVGRLAILFPKGGVITPAELQKVGAVRAVSGMPPQVKILAGGDIAVALTITDCVFSKSAGEKIIKAGGTIKE